MRRFTVLLLLLFNFSCTGSLIGPGTVIPEGCRQMILVVTETPDTDKAVMTFWEREGSGDWNSAGFEADVTVGRNGLAWGDGLNQLPADSDMGIKREGDGKSPAGMFRLGRFMGYDSAAPAGVRMPYTVIREDMECVDDPESVSYNRILRRSSVTSPDWNSSERMRNCPGDYDLLITVEHNSQRKKGSGSCIFIHLRPSSESRTAGCTALDADDMITLLKLLDPADDPLLVQLTRSMYDRLYSSWHLPEIDRKNEN